MSRMSSPRAGAWSPTVEAAAVAMTALAATPVLDHRRHPSRSTTAAVVVAAKALPGYGEEESKGMEPEEDEMPTHRRQQEQQQVEQQLAPSGSFASASASTSPSRPQRKRTLTGHAKAALAVEGELRELLGPKGMASGEEEEGVEDNSEEDGKEGKGEPKGKGAKKPAPVAVSGGHKKKAKAAAAGAAVVGKGKKKTTGKGTAQGEEEEELIVRLPYPAGKPGKHSRGKGKGKAPPKPTAGVNRNGDPKKRYNWTKEEDAALRALVRRGLGSGLFVLVGRWAVCLVVYMCSLTQFIQRQCTDGQVEGLGTSHWPSVAKRLGGRSAKQCYQRWNYALVVDDATRPWDTVEDLQVRFLFSVAPTRNHTYVHIDQPSVDHTKTNNQT